MGRIVCEWPAYAGSGFCDNQYTNAQKDQLYMINFVKDQPMLDWASVTTGRKRKKEKKKLDF